VYYSVLWCVAVCGSVWQCVVVCGSVLRCDEVCCWVQRIVTFANVFQDRALVWCGVFAVCGSVLKCEEVYCIVLCCSILMNAANCDFFRMCIRIARWCVVLCCSVRRCIAVCVCGSVLHCIDVQYVDECNQL